MSFSPNTALREMRHRWYVVVGLLFVVTVAVWLSHGALQDSDERRASRARIEANTVENARLTAVVVQQGEDIKRLLAAVENATSPEAQARGAATLAGAIAELRLSTNCVGLYFHDERPAPCAEVDARLDALRSGVDPFARPTPPSTGGPS